MFGTAVVVGASGRAAAASLRRAGVTPAVVDLFADRDTRLLGETIRCPFEAYPGGLSDLARRLPPGPVVYTGGLENEPEVIDRLASDREVWGNQRDAVAAVRDPHGLRTCLGGLGWKFPRSYTEPPDRPYVIKRRRSSGGLGVRAGDGRIGLGEIAEEFIAGRLLSAQYVGKRFLGLTEQLAGEPWLHSPPYHYAGNIGPTDVVPSLRSILEETASRLSLRGPWGIDLIRNETGVYFLEVNPRYTAGVEVLELSAGSPLAFVGPTKEGRRTGTVTGKAVYYSPFPITFPPAGPWDVDLVTPWNPWQIPAFADIPMAGEPFRPGHPVLTIFATDSTPEGVMAKLMGKAHLLDDLFSGKHT